MAPGISPLATKALRPWNPTGKVPAPNVGLGNRAKRLGRSERSEIPLKS